MGYCDKELTDEYTPQAESFIQRIKELLEYNKPHQESPIQFS